MPNSFPDSVSGRTRPPLRGENRQPGWLFSGQPHGNAIVASPDAVRSSALLSLGGSLTAAGAPANAHAPIVDAADRAFVDGLSRGSLVCAIIVGLGALFALPRTAHRLRPAVALAPATALDTPGG